MNNNEIQSQVVGILTAYAKNKKGLENISPASRIIEDLGINSARMIDIVADLEDKFKISITDETADQMDTVGNMVKILSDQVRA